MAPAGQDTDVATGEVAQQSFASDQFQAASNPLPGQSGQGTLGDSGATSGNRPSDLLQQVLVLLGSRFDVTHRTAALSQTPALAQNVGGFFVSFKARDRRHRPL